MARENIFSTILLVGFLFLSFRANAGETETGFVSNILVGKTDSGVSWVKIYGLTNNSGCTDVGMQFGEGLSDVNKILELVEAAQMSGKLLRCIANGCMSGGGPSVGLVCMLNDQRR